MKTFKLFSMAALILTMAACSSDDNVTEQQPEQTQKTIHFKATIGLEKGTATRTTYYEDETNGIDVAWTKGDKIALIHNGVINVVLVDKVDSETKNATIEGKITVTEGMSTDVKLVYPAEIVNEATGGTNYSFDESYIATKGLNQDGTLEYIAQNLDTRTGSGSFVINGDEATLGDQVEMNSQIAIWKFNLTSNSSPISAKGLTLSFQLPYNIQTVARAIKAEGSSTYYMCVVPSVISKINQSNTYPFVIDANDGTNHYKYTRSNGLNLAVNKFYKSTVDLTPITPAPTLSLLNSPQPYLSVVINFVCQNSARYASFLRPVPNPNAPFNSQVISGSAGRIEIITNALTKDNSGNFVYTLKVHESKSGQGDDWTKFGFTVTFNPTNNTYSVSNVDLSDLSGTAVDCCFTGIVINGTDITSTLTRE